MLVKAKGQQFYLGLKYDKDKGLQVDTSKMSEEQASMVLKDEEVRTKVNLEIMKYILALDSVSEDEKIIMVENLVVKWSEIIIIRELNDAFEKLELEDEETLGYA